MTLKQAMAKLEAIKGHYGDQIEVFFDCPKCGLSFTPSLVQTAAIHLKADTEGAK